MFEIVCVFGGVVEVVGDGEEVWGVDIDFEWSDFVLFYVVFDFVIVVVVL